MAADRGQRLWWPLLAGLTLALLLAGCGGRPVQPFLPGEAVWQPGERTVYRVLDADGNDIGTAVYVMDGSGADPESGRWRLAREIAMGNVREESVVTLTARSYKPVSGQMTRVSLGGREQTETFFNGSQVDIVLTTGEDARTTRRVSIATDARDERSLPYVVRTLPLGRGYATRFNSFLPVAGRMEQVTLRVTGEEVLESPLGSLSAWRVSLESPDGGRTRLWVDREPPHSVLRMVDDRSRATLELVTREP